MKKATCVRGSTEERVGATCKSEGSKRRQRPSTRLLSRASVKESSRDDARQDRNVSILIRSARPQREIFDDSFWVRWASFRFFNARLTLSSISFTCYSVSFPQPLGFRSPVDLSSDICKPRSSPSASSCLTRPSSDSRLAQSYPLDPSFLAAFVNRSHRRPKSQRLSAPALLTRTLTTARPKRDRLAFEARVHDCTKGEGER